MKFIYAKAIVKKGSLDRFLEITKDLVNNTRSEKGNQSYNLVQIDANNDLEYAFIELWNSQEAIENHVSQPHFINGVNALKDVLVKDLEITISDVVL